LHTAAHILENQTYSFVSKKTKEKEKRKKKRKRKKKKKKKIEITNRKKRISNKGFGNCPIRFVSVGVRRKYMKRRCSTSLSSLRLGAMTQLVRFY
jgi:hypothetical protein